MSLDWYQDVLEFHRKFRPNMIGDKPGEPEHGTRGLRAKLMMEELRETVEAMQSNDLAGVADGLADLIYVAIGCAVSYGIDLQPVWDAVHAANMAKVGGGSRPDGKVLKPPGWQAPDIESIIEHQQRCPAYRLAPIRIHAVAPMRNLCRGHERHADSPFQCCPRAGEYNGFASDGPLKFACPIGCSCHD